MFSRGTEGPMEIVESPSDSKRSIFSRGSAAFSLERLDLPNKQDTGQAKQLGSQQNITNSFERLELNKEAATDDKQFNSKPNLPTCPLDFEQCSKDQAETIKPGTTDTSFSFSARSIADNSISPATLASILRSSPTKRFAGIKKKLVTKKRSAAEHDSLQDSNNSIKEPPVGQVKNHFYFLYLYMGYLQLAFNGFLIGIVIYLIVQFVLTIKRDVEIKVQGQMAEILNEISHCSRQYLENRCHPETRVPAMEKACAAWELCMNRDPAVVGRAKVSAITFAEIINSFVEPISIKTMLFFVLMIAALFVIGNVVLGVARSKELRHATQHQPAIAQLIANTNLPPAHSSSGAQLTPIQFYSQTGPSNSSLVFSPMPHK